MLDAIELNSCVKRLPLPHFSVPEDEALGGKRGAKFLRGGR
jgi:hypothetical protein